MILKLKSFGEKMNKQLMIITGLLSMLITVSVFPSNVIAYSPFDQVASGDELQWTVLDTNETVTRTWYNVDWSLKGTFNVMKGQKIIFQVDDPSVGNGTIKIGGLTVEGVNPLDISFNLNLMTDGPWIPFYNNSFAPAFISSTDWQTQIEAAINATNDRVGMLGSAIVITSANKTFLGQTRATISFNYSMPGTIANATYDNETGILLYHYMKVELGTTWWLEIVLATSTPIPSFELIISYIALSVLVLIVLQRRFSPKNPNYNRLK